MTSSSESASGSAERRDFVLALADDALIASHRLSEWVARCPTIEEDVALANIALDLLGQARLFYALLGDEDELAYRRSATEFRNASMLERPSGDFGRTIARLLLLSAHQFALYDELRTLKVKIGDDADLAAIAGKAVKEVTYHRDHARAWTLRLGDGTTESHQRMQAGVDLEWAGFAELLGVAGDGSAATAWAEQVLAEATLTVPGPVLPARRGQHTADLDDILAEMREVAAAHPGATW